jgi:hypothetical protein
MLVNPVEAVAASSVQASSVASPGLAWIVTCALLLIAACSADGDEPSRQLMVRVPGRAPVETMTLVVADGMMKV